MLKTLIFVLTAVTSILAQANVEPQHQILDGLLVSPSHHARHTLNRIETGKWIETQTGIQLVGPIPGAKGKETCVAPGTLSSLGRNEDSKFYCWGNWEYDPNTKKLSVAFHDFVGIYNGDYLAFVLEVGYLDNVRHIHFYPELDLKVVEENSLFGTVYRIQLTTH